jgi:hypothetical protein
MKNSIIRCFAFSCVLFGGPAMAQTYRLPTVQAVDKTKPHWQFRSILQGRNNQLGLGMNLEARWRTPLYGDTQNVLLKGCYLDVGGIARVSPASLHHGLFVEYVPVAPLQFRFGIGRLAYFGLFGTVIEYESPQSDWSPQALLDNQPKAAPGGGMAWRASGKLRLKFGPVVALHEQLLMGFSIDAIPQDSYWYEPINDMLVGQRDQIWAMKSTLGYLLYGQLQREFLVVAAHHESYKAFETKIERQIAGVASLYRPNYDWWGHPQFVLLAGAMIQDVHRDGSLYIGAQIVTTFDIH